MQIFKVMNKHFLLCAILCTWFFAGNIHAQQQTTSTPDSPLYGLWTLVGENVNGKFKPTVRSNKIFKMITKDNQFMNFIITGERSLISAFGGVELRSDSVYVEKIEKSLNTTLNGEDNEMHYNIKEDNLLYVRFFLEKNALNQPLNQWYEELWIRVMMPDDKNNNIINSFENLK